MFKGYALFATTDVLEALFAAGPTPQRCPGRAPGTGLGGGGRSDTVRPAGGRGLTAGNPFRPQVDRSVEIRLLDLTSRVELTAFDEPGFHDAMLRARDRGLFSASQVVSSMLDCMTGAAGIVSAAVVVGLLQPVLLAPLVIAELPGGWAAVRSARNPVPGQLRARRQPPPSGSCRT